MPQKEQVSSLSNALQAIDSQLAAKADLVNGKVPAAQIPSIAINDTFAVNSEAEMVSLSAQKGDLAVRADIEKTFVLQGDDPTILSSWQEILSPTAPVRSVNNKTGSVVLTPQDVGASPASHTHVSSDISELAEAIDDRIAALLQAGSGVTISYNDAANTLTISASGIGEVVSQTEPTSPAIGLLWREVDANGVTIGRWERRSTPVGDRWLAQQPTEQGIVLTNASSMQSFTNLTPIRNGSGEVFFESLQLTMLVANGTGHNNDSYYRFEIGVFDGQNSGSVDYVVTSQAFTLPNNRYVLRQDTGIMYIRPNAYRLGISGFSSPGNYRASFVVYTREVR